MAGGRRQRGEHKRSAPGLPLISIITVVLNGEQSLERTIASVLNQDYGNIEFLVVDGGSTDGTVPLLEKYDEGIDYWISERDEGIYDAMNKGIDAAHGDWLFFLGADDMLFDSGTISFVARELREEQSIVYGNILYPDQRVVRSRFNLFTLLHNTIHHQGAFYNARLFAGWRYDTGFRLIADYELNLKIYLEKMNHRAIDRIISVCNPAGQSRANLELAFAETNLARKKFFGRAANALLSGLYFVKFKIYTYWLMEK